jgi:hypothetical protein
MTIKAQSEKYRERLRVSRYFHFLKLFLKQPHFFGQETALMTQYCE